MKKDKKHKYTESETFVWYLLGRLIARTKDEESLVIIAMIVEQLKNSEKPF